MMIESMEQICGAENEPGLAALRSALLGPEQAAEIAQLFKALSDPSRVRLISVLARGEVCVHTLATLAGMSHSAVSHQLRSLRELRLVRARKAGRHVFYRLDDQHIARLFEAGVEHTSHA